MRGLVATRISDFYNLDLKRCKNKSRLDSWLLRPKQNIFLFGPPSGK